jgi:hypothetical protein
MAPTAHSDSGQGAASSGIAAALVGVAQGLMLGRGGDGGAQTVGSLQNLNFDFSELEGKDAAEQVSLSTIPQPAVGLPPNMRTNYHCPPHGTRLFARIILS